MSVPGIDESSQKKKGGALNYSSDINDRII